MLISDGKHRRMDNPKKKKIKHLYFTGEVIRGYSEREEEFGISNPFLRLSLRPYQNKKLEEGLCQRTLFCAICERSHEGRDHFRAILRRNRSEDGRVQNG